VRFQIGRGPGSPVELDAELQDHRGSLPGALTIRTAKERVEIVLQEWRSIPGLDKPPFLSVPECGDGVQ
jgi:hypothetical protein